MRSRVFRRRISLGFAAVASLCLLITVISFHALRTVIEAKDVVISDYAHNLLRVRELELNCEQEISSSRAYLLTRDADFEAKALRSRREFIGTTASLRMQLEKDERGLLEQVIDAEKAHWDAMALVIKEADGNLDLRSLSRYFEETVMPKRDDLREAFRTLIETEKRQLESVLGDSRRAASRMSILVVVIGVSAVVVAVALFALSWRTLRRLASAEQEVHDLNQTLEGRIADRTAELTRTVRELEGFAYTIAHDLRAPLRAISGFSRLMIDDFGKEIREPGSEYLARIDAAARRMDELIVGLLDYSRLSYSDIELLPVDLDVIVRAVLKALEGEIEKKRAVVQVEGHLERVLANEALLRQTLENLISNAIKFVGADVLPEVRIRTELRPGRVRLWVSDNGIGIAAEHQERIFGVFQRLNRAEDYSGTGIGLAIVRKAVERMGGQVGVESQPRQGSRFWVDLRAV
jgi:signal transduction histidine kinase